MRTVIILLMILGTGLAAQKKKKPKNVLFIIVDDLRPVLGCYGDKLAKTPNIDKLAKNGMIFTKAYAQQALCNPSRTSIFTGVRPDTSKIYGSKYHFRKYLPTVQTLPQIFKIREYKTVSFGKVFHGAFRNSKVSKDDEVSWTDAAWKPGPRYYFTKEGVESAREAYKRNYNRENVGPNDWTEKWVTSLSTEAPDISDRVLYDGQVASRVLRRLNELKRSPQPFFLACGFLRPHMPYVAPKKYWDLYKREDFKLAANNRPPLKAPEIALHESGEVRSYDDVPMTGSIVDEKKVDLLHGYYACVSYIDAQIGLILDELRRLNFHENTLIVLVSDHGFHLEEQGLWSKMTNFDAALHVPLIISYPGMKNAGKKCDSVVELVDIMPTVLQLFGMTQPKILEGRSLVELLDNPEKNWGKVAFSQYPRKGNRDLGGAFMGYTMRTDRYRFTRWKDNKTKRIVAVECYDYEKDPLCTRNIAEELANKELMKKLAELFDKEWEAYSKGVK